MGRSAAPTNRLARNDDRLLSIDLKPIATIAARLRSGSLTSTALTKHLLRPIEAIDPELNAFVTVTADLALRQAIFADTERAEGIVRGPLHGVPIALKDNIDTNGIRTTRGSCLFDNHEPHGDAAIVSRLRDAGAVLLGKTAMHEFAYGMNGINPHFGATQNPWRPDHDAGGSSGGSAAPVAAGLAVAAIGTDTGGSVRQPAHCCGVVGFKPTYGEIDTDGVFPLVQSMDHVGVITKSVADARILYQALRQSDQNAAQDPKPRPTPYIRDLLVGVIRPGFFEGHRVAITVVDRALGRIKASGASLVELGFGKFDAALQATRTTFAEANDVLWKLYSDNPERVGADVARKLEAAEGVTPEAYEEAQRFRVGFRDDVEQLFDKCDLIALPTSTIAAAAIEAHPDDHAHLAWRNCGHFNFTGHPAISLPAGRTVDGLPVGLMLVGSLHCDDRFLNHAELIETALGWTDREGGFG